MITQGHVVLTGDEAVTLEKALPVLRGLAYELQENGKPEDQKSSQTLKDIESMIDRAMECYAMKRYHAR